MNKTLPTLLIAAAAALVSVAAPMPASAEDSKDSTLEPDKGPNPDRTVRDRYLMAMHEAQTRLSSSLAQCDRMQSADRAQCVRGANDTHEADVARANDFLDRPR